MKYNENIPISVNRIILKAMQKDPNLRYQNATEMVQDLSLALKKPNEDFVILATRNDDSPTQKIPTLYEIEMEKNNDRKAPKIDESKSKNAKENKIKVFYENHKWAKPVTILLIAVILFVGAMFATIGFLNADRPAQVQIPNVAGQNNEKRMSKDEAIKALNDLGIQDITVEEEYNDEVEEGYVISQTPEYQL